MEDKVKLTPKLFIFKDENKLSAPQKCKIPHDAVSFPATSLILVKSGNKTFICRLFYLNECYNSKYISYMDGSVELNPDDSCNSEIKYIERLEKINKSQITEFSEIKVKIVVDYVNLNLDIIKSHDDFCKLIKSILKHFVFTSDCSISCNKFGIKKIDIKSTCDNNKYGKLSRNGKLEIEEILVETSNFARKNITLGGLKDAKHKLQNIISNILEYRQCPRNFLIKPRSQVLIHGVTGVGKSSLVYYISKTHNCNIFEISADVFKPYPGETEEELQKIFNRITKISNLISSNISIILIENIELFCPKVENKLNENSHSSRIASFIYSFLDEISSNVNGILVIGTTSKIEQVNTALRRFNRLGIEISLDMPDEDERYEIMRTLVNQMFNNTNIQDVENLCREVAKNTIGFVGADLEILCQYVLRQYDNVQHDIKYLFENGYQKINPSVIRENFGTATKSTMTFKDIGGMEDVKKLLLTSVLGPLRHPEKFKLFGLNVSSGILLYGASGCAKTTIVKCLAGESKMTLISVSSAEIYSPYVGEAEKFLVRLFNQARMSAPAILFFDEIDTIVGNRNNSNGTNDAHLRILSTLLTEIDGFSGRDFKNKPILIIGATNRPECIDDALMRPGRFDKLIHISAPDYNYRLQILKFLSHKMPLADDVNLEDIALRTNFFSGADLVNLCNEAAMCAATRDLNCNIISSEDFEDVLAFLRPSLNQEIIEYYEQFAKNHTRKI